MTKNTLKESLFLVENIVKIIISSHEMPKESCFNSDDSLSNKTFFMKKYNICKIWIAKPKIQTQIMDIYAMDPFSWGL